MPTINNNLWCIRGGRDAEAGNLFIKKNVIALAWYQVGDLSNFANDRELFRQAVAQVPSFSDYPSGTIGQFAGQLYRFVHEMEIDDLVVFPYKLNDEVYLGQVKSPYIYSPHNNRSFIHQREVKWLHHYSWTVFSEPARNAIQCQLSFFRIKNAISEFQKAFDGKFTSAS